MAESRYLSGNFAPVSDELTVTDLTVRGRIPAELNGRYFRNGPNPITPPDPATYHWFSGTGMVHGVRLRDGGAEWYRNRWVRSGSVCDTLGEPRREGPVHNDFDFSPNTNVIGHAGKVLAIVEAGGLPYELTDELDTVGPTDLDGTLPSGYTAHPKLDPATGELFAMSYYWGQPYIEYTVIGTDGRVRHRVEVPVDDGPMIHDMGLTETRAMVLDLPVTFDLERAGTGVFPYSWNPDHGARVGVLPREGTAEDLVWCELAELSYVYHPLNSYDLDDGRIVMDVVRHPKMFATDPNGPNEGPPTLWRWTVDPSAGKVLEEQLDDRGQEFPRVDPRLEGRRHTIGWSAGLDNGVEHGDLIKHDLVTGTTTVHSHGPGRVTGEAVFIPRDGGTGEDDGWVMSLVYDTGRDTSELVLLDAATLDEVAAVELPRRVPFGFHGNWIPDPA